MYKHPWTDDGYWSIGPSHVLPAGVQEARHFWDHILRPCSVFSGEIDYYYYYYYYYSNITNSYLHRCPLSLKQEMLNLVSRRFNSPDRKIYYKQASDICVIVLVWSHPETKTSTWKTLLILMNTFAKFWPYLSQEYSVSNNGAPWNLPT